MEKVQKGYKEELLRHVGSLQQVASIRPLTFAEGRSSGTKAFELRCGKLACTVMADKCLDIAAMSYGGVNMSFLSKPGLQGLGHYDTNGQEAVRSIMGGLLFTAGLENICAPCTVDGVDYPMHGRLRSTPAEHLASDARWEGEDYVLEISGEMREAALFGENLVLRRKISTRLGSNTLVLSDTFTNESFAPQPLMLLYHINLGYPFLNEDLRLYIPTRSVAARDEAAAGREDAYDRMDAPRDGAPEYVFIHELRTGPDGCVALLAVNPPLGLGLKLEYNAENLPYFMQWKSTAAGDYALGLEPANSSVFGRSFHAERGNIHKLDPLASEHNELRFTVLEGTEAIRREIERFRR